MKRKLTINTLAMGNLKQRRKQYTILIIGIILAMVFSSGVMFFISCTKSSNEEYQRRAIGDFYGYYFACEDFVDVEQGVKDGLIESYGYAHILGYAYTDEEKMEKGTPVAWLDEDAKDLYYVHFLEGRYPEAKGEIAIEKDAALRLGIKPELGKEISVSMLTANYTDFLGTSTEKTYTIVGILTDKRKNLEKFVGLDGVPQFPSALVSSEETVDLGGREIPAVFFNATDKSLKEKVPDPSIGMDGTIFYSNSFFVNFIQPIYNKAENVYGPHDGTPNFMHNVSASYCKTKITKTMQIPLDEPFLNYITSFDFSIIKSYPMAQIIDEYLDTTYGNIRFGGRSFNVPSQLTPEASVEPEEMNYILALFEAYSEEIGTNINTIEELKNYKNYFDHFNRQRKDYYCVETIRRFLRDTATDSRQFDVLKAEIYNGIIDVHEQDYENGYKRLIADLQHATVVNTSKCLLDSNLGLI